MQIQRRDGKHTDVEAAATAFKDQGATAIQIVLRDITERKRAEASLQESEKRQRALARQLLEAQESERRHLAHELHDETGQTLTAIKITLQAAQRVGEDRMRDLVWHHPGQDAVERAFDARHEDVLNLKVDPRLDVLRRHGRFASLVRRSGFP